MPVKNGGNGGGELSPDNNGGERRWGVAAGKEREDGDRKVLQMPICNWVKAKGEMVGSSSTEKRDSTQTFTWHLARK